MNHKLCLLLFLLINLTLCDQENIRFADGPMMRKHHQEQPINADNITVHIIAHSHDDVGWLKTVDQYFYGANQSIQPAGVQYTIDTVVEQLSRNPNYKFSIVEVAFLYRWWNNANSTWRDRMTTLITNGQLQFINGGWCMSDQATPYYQDVIDQMSIGLRWLKETFNYIPDVAWHIDPFGHQASSATLFNQMGLQSFFFSRIDYQDKSKRMNQSTLQMVWYPTLTVPDSNNYIFTHVNYYHYSPPPGFCFDILCITNSDPIRYDPTMDDYNLPNKSNAFVDYFKSMSNHYRTRNLMHTFGQDFHYADARTWYKNLDYLINYINAKPELGVKFQYSTPSNYIKSIRQQGQTYPKKTDDFFPYADSQHSYWTGYFTSRVAVKGFVRDMGRWVQSIRKQISQIKIRGTSEIIKNNLKLLEDRTWQLQTSMGILQHHDAVSGTEKQKVAENYISTALKSIQKFLPLHLQIIKQQVNQQIGQSPPEQAIFFNIYWNDTAQTTGVYQKILNNKTILLALYNPGPAKKRNIKINVPQLDLRVLSWVNNSTIAGDIVCTDINSPTNCQLFITLDFPQSGNTYVKLYHDTRSPTAKVIKLKQMSIIELSKQFKLTPTATIKITKSNQKFDLTLGNLTETFFVNYSYYEAYQGTGPKSGAYLFRPANDTTKKYTTYKAVHFAEGTEMVVIILEGDTTYTKLYFSKVADYVNTKGFEIQTRINSINITDKIGKEITFNLQTTYQNNKTFFTDSNGLQQQKRILNYRPTWPLNVTQPSSGNYYPVNSHITILDSNTSRRVTVLTDRSEGGTVLKEGVIELMIHRRLLMDDAKGVGQPLNQTQPDGSGRGLIQNVRHYVIFGNNYRQLQMQNDQKIAITIIDTNTTTFLRRSPTPVAISVPPTVKLYLRSFIDGSYLLRVQNFEKNVANVNLTGWQATELTLSANQLLSEWIAKKYQWKVEQSETDQQEQIEQIEQQTQMTVLQKLQSWAKQLLPIKLFSSTHTDPIQSNQHQHDQAGPFNLTFLQIRTFNIVKSV